MTAWPQRAALLLCLALAGVTAVRSAIVTATVESRPEAALVAWPSHPDAMIAAALSDIGKKAAAGRSPDDKTLRLVEAAATRAPLAHEPFLIGGTQAMTLGQSGKSERLLTEARRRDPRAMAPRDLIGFMK